MAAISNTFAQEPYFAANRPVRDSSCARSRQGYNEVWDSMTNALRAQTARLAQNVITDADIVHVEAVEVLLPTEDGGATLFRLDPVTGVQPVPAPLKNRLTGLADRAIQASA